VWRGDWRGLQGADEGISRSWPTRRRVSSEGGTEDVLPRKEKRYWTQCSNSKRSRGDDCHE
jgi:hypothetical protein